MLFIITIKSHALLTKVIYSRNESKINPGSCATTYTHTYTSRVCEVHLQNIDHVCCLLLNIFNTCTCHFAVFYALIGICFCCGKFATDHTKYCDTKYESVAFFFSTFTTSEKLCFDFLHL